MSLQFFEETQPNKPINLKKWFKKAKKDYRKKYDFPLKILTLFFEETPKPANYFGLNQIFSGFSMAERHARLANVLMEYVDFICVDDTEELLYYNSDTGIWCNGGEKIVKKFCYTFNDPMKVSIAKECLEKIKVTKYRNRKFLDEGRHIAVKNGVINLDDKDLPLIPHNKDLWLTKGLDVEYDPNIQSEKIENFLSEIIKEKDIRLLEEIIGYTLYPDYKFHKFFIMLGGGSNGKSTLLNMIIAFLGKENISSVYISNLSPDRYGPASLFGKMANIVPDLPSTDIEDTSLLKGLTGGDYIEARQIYGYPFQFINQAKIIVSCNYLPKMVFDDSYALWRRIVLIDFPNKFEGDNCDENLLEKLTTPEELSGLLNIALRGLKRLLEHGRFEKDSEANILETKRNYLMLSDSSRSFINQAITESSGNLILKSEVDDAYEKWVTMNRSSFLSPDSKTLFTKRLKEYIFGCKVVQRTIDGVKQRYWIGIKFSDFWKKLTTPDNGD